MVIDGHAHACGEYLTAESIQKKLSENHVNMVVLVPGELNSSKTYRLKDYASENPKKDALTKTNKMTKLVIAFTRMKKRIPKGNEYVFQLKNILPDKVKQFFWITKEQWNDIDRKYEIIKFDGIKLHQCWEGFKIDSYWFKEVMDWSIAKELPVFIHLYSHKEIMSLIHYIKNNQKSKIIVGHNFGIEYFINENIQYFNNIFFDLSNNYFVSKERLKLTLKYFGSTKLLMGSDTPYGVDSLQKCIQRINRLNISQNEKENILGINMKNILGIQ